MIQRLRRLPLFQRLSDDELNDLAERIRLRPFRRSEVIFRKDDPGTHLYLVLDGAVKITLPGEFGQEALVAIIRPGEFFGELALFDRSPRSASAVASAIRARSASSSRRWRARSGACPTGSRTSRSSTCRAAWRSTCSTSATRAKARRRSS